MSEEKNATVPSRALPVLPLRQDVLLPGSTFPVPVGRKSSLSLLRAVRAGDHIYVAVQRDASVQEPGIADLHPVVVEAEVERTRLRSHRGPHLVLRALERRELVEVTQLAPHLVGRAQPLTSAVPEAEVEQAVESLVGQLDELLDGANPGLAPVVEALQNESNPSDLADRTAAILGLAFEKELEVLLELNVVARLELVGRLLTETRTLNDVNARVQGEIRREMHKTQREAILREQLKAIQKELGEGEGQGGDVDELKERLAAKELPEEVQKVVDKELGRLGRLQGAEQSVVRTYLEWIAEVPWTERAEGEVSIDDVEARLNADHAGLDDVKVRILEHLAVLRVSGGTRGTILCLAGPPGVGKTSLGQSVADALGRPFVRVALGGVRDEAEVRGHRRTYVGALPGRIVSALKKAQVKNPVFLLDEIDKLGRGWAGDPEAALLEVLDPEQNDSFTDHYLELPVDLSEVLFICTANDLSQLSPPLRDRLEIIELDGYTSEEKKQIAKSHLLPRRLEEHKLTEASLVLDEGALDAIISGWTREAGVRQLDRMLTKICRAVALQVARGGAGPKEPLRVHADNLDKLLGKQRFFDEVAERTQLPGVATGLAWTPVGGDILFIESSRMKGSGKVETTGQLGDVMKESARAALTYVRSHTDELGVDPDFLEASDIHLHIPAGAVPKDGPSAGVTMFTALVSLLTGRRVRPDTAMTGEATLRGRVLPVGGIKSKVLAAHRAGLRRVVLPERNRKDVADIPDAVREEMTFVFATDMHEVLEAALEPTGASVTPSSPRGRGENEATAH